MHPLGAGLVDCLDARRSTALLATWLTGTDRSRERGPVSRRRGVLGFSDSSNCHKVRPDAALPLRKLTPAHWPLDNDRDARIRLHIPSKRGQA